MAKWEDLRAGLEKRQVVKVNLSFALLLLKAIVLFHSVTTQLRILQSLRIPVDSLKLFD